MPSSADTFIPSSADTFICVCSDSQRFIFLFTPLAREVKDGDNGIHEQTAKQTTQEDTHEFRRFGSLMKMRSKYLLLAKLN
jgi:hypothetical protein